MNHNMAQLLSMMVKEYYNDWGEQLPPVEAGFNELVKPGTVLAPNKAQLGTLPRIPVTVIERCGTIAHKSLGRSQLGFPLLFHKSSSFICLIFLSTFE